MEKFESEWEKDHNSVSCSTPFLFSDLYNIYGWKFLFQTSETSEYPYVRGWFWCDHVWCDRGTKTDMWKCSRDYSDRYNRDLWMGRKDRERFHTQCGAGLGRSAQTSPTLGVESFSVFSTHPQIPIVPVRIISGAFSHICLCSSVTPYMIASKSAPDIRIFWSFWSLK